MNDKFNNRSQTNNQSTPMKTYLKLGALALLAAASTASIPAATTNLVQNLTFKMTAWTQGTTVTNGNIVSVPAIAHSIVTKDIIGWLSTATTNNSFTNSQLVVINQLGVPESKTVIMVRTKSKLSKKQSVTNDVDVSGFFATVANAATVNNYSYNNSSNVVNPGTYYGYWSFYFLSDTNHVLLPVTFLVTGLGVDTAVNITGPKKAVLGLADQFGITNAAGTGMMNNTPFIIGGNIVINGKTLEVHP